jgi:TetR/AcrR family acrAB operon transcriptional repressor
MARKTKSQAEETRQRLLMAALDVFCEKGYSRTTLMDVAQRIGMTRGAVYWHFASKENLVATLLREMQKREEELVRRKVPDQTCRRFMYLITMQMERSVELLDAIAKEMGPIQRWPFARMRDALGNAQRNGEIRPEVSVDEVVDALRGLWMGVIEGFMLGVSRRKPWRAVDLGFRAVINEVRA